EALTRAALGHASIEPVLSPHWTSHRLIFFFFNDPATTEIYTLSLHDALPIWPRPAPRPRFPAVPNPARRPATRSEEHTSELQSRSDLVCRLLLEKKKKQG